MMIEYPRHSPETIPNSWPNYIILTIAGYILNDLLCGSNKYN